MLATTLSARDHRRATWATAVFCAAFLVSRVQPFGGHLGIDLRPQYWELPLLIVLAIHASRAQRGNASRAMWILWLVLLVGTIGFWVYGGAPGQGSDGAYFYSWLLWSLYVAVAGLVAFVFFDERIFYRVWWWLGISAMVLALVGFVLARYTGMLALAQYANYGGGLRLTGLLSEPSAWAPVLTSLAFMAIRDQRWIWCAPILLAIFLSRSPTVAITFAISAATLFLLQHGRIYRKLVAAAVVVVILPSTLAVFDDPREADLLLKSGNPLKILLGRILSGLQYILSDGHVGTNDRFEGARDVWNSLMTHGWLWTGRGIGASDVYFSTVLGDFRAYSLPLSILFDLGIIALAIYIMVAARAVWRLRNRSIRLVLVPFIVASAINSAQGIQMYKFTVLALLLYGLSRRWVPDGDPDKPEEAASVSRTPELV